MKMSETRVRRFHVSKGQRTGYVRVSSYDQNPDRRLEHLEVDRVFTDKASGKDADRPQLKVLLSYAREGTLSSSTAWIVSRETWTICAESCSVRLVVEAGFTSSRKISFSRAMNRQWQT